MVDWGTCEHIWQENAYSEYSNDLFTDVTCLKCGVPGQLTNKTGEVYWPAT